jgi:hypothetical protein
MLQEMMFYMECLKVKDTAHRKIHNRMNLRFKTSPAAVKDALLRDGYIVLDYIKREKNTNKIAHYYKLTGKVLHGVETVVKQEIKVWPDGTLKSTNNAFNWRSNNSALYSNREISLAQQKFDHHKQITVYSRA